MGLAASQARFLCLTARKANCEFRSTELAQQKLEITNQLSDISNDYAQAINATKLMWSNDGVDGDYGLTYSLLMTPSPMNDFNPYMVTTPSGSVVLNERYAAAARAAGLSKAGGIGSQQSRDKFISALVSQGMVTDTTAKNITQYNYEAEYDSGKNVISFVNEASVAQDPNFIQWNPAAGMGAEPLNKGAAESMNLTTMALSEAIGLQTLDWAKIFTKSDEMTEVEYKKALDKLNDLKMSLNTGAISDDVRAQLQNDLANYISANENIKDTAEYNKEVERLQNLIYLAENGAGLTIKDGKCTFCGKEIKDSRGNVITSESDISIKDGAYVDKYYQELITENGNEIRADWFSEIRNQISDDYNNFVEKNKSTCVKVDDVFNVKENSLAYDKNGNKAYNVVYNGVIDHYSDEIKNMTIGDLLTQQVVLVANGSISTGGAGEDLKAFNSAALKMLDSIAAIFGYSPSESLMNTGLCVDDVSQSALKFAYDMVKGTYLKTNNYEHTGSRMSDKSMTENTAYINATTYNRIGSDSDGAYFAVSLSQMTAAFLTYFDNALAGANSSYVVGKSVGTSTYVTDNSSYKYFVQADTKAVNTADKKYADFFDELYNNILEHGWREDAALDDNEYLETTLKNGRYSMASLNKDGYYYQTRYNDTGYMVEVSDTDAIARAEAEFTAKKAELTFKEDSIDLKTKNLDAEIAAISTEYDAVKNLIAKGIEKTFQMFSN